MIIDLIVAVILLISAVISFIRGFIREVLTIAGVVGGLVASYMGGPVLKPIMRDLFGLNETAQFQGAEEAEKASKFMDIIPYTLLSDALAYASIFLIVVIVLSIISHFIAEGARSIGLGAVDRTLGVIFGIARGVLLLGLFYLPFHMFLDQETKDNFFKDSRTHIYLEETAKFFESLLPEGTKETVEDAADDVEGAVSTQDKLKEIGLLKNGEAAPVNAASAPDPSQPGYEDGFRNQMNDLFQQQQETDFRNQESGAGNE